MENRKEKMETFYFFFFFFCKASIECDDDDGDDEHNGMHSDVNDFQEKKKNKTIVIRKLT